MALISVYLDTPWNSWIVVALPCDGKFVPAPIVGNAFGPHPNPWRGGQLLGWLWPYATFPGIILTIYLGILSWITSLLLVLCNLGHFPKNHVFYSCALIVFHWYLTDIQKNCDWHVTPLSHPRDILPSYVYILSSFLPQMGCMGWSRTHTNQDPSPYFHRSVVHCTVGHTPPFLFKCIGLVSPCFL